MGVVSDDKGLPLEDVENAGVSKREERNARGEGRRWYDGAIGGLKKRAPRIARGEGRGIDR